MNLEIGKLYDICGVDCITSEEGIYSGAEYIGNNQNLYQFKYKNSTVAFDEDDFYLKEDYQTMTVKDLINLLGKFNQDAYVQIELEPPYAASNFVSLAGSPIEIHEDNEVVNLFVVPKYVVERDL